ncbi:hypothetical protein ACLMJK_007136 [Lecanora helva]
MEFPRVTSPPSVRVHDHSNGSHGRKHSTSRPAGVPFSSRSPGPVAIPNTRLELAPPPLPPPRVIEDLDAGSDPGWAWGNSASGKPGKLGGSIASSGNYPKSWARDMGDNRKQQPPERLQFSRRESSASALRSPTNAERKHHDFARHQDEGYYSLSGPRTSAMSQHAYSETPYIKKEPPGFDDSPQSRPMSPFSNGNPNNFIQWRSPTFERSTPSSATEIAEHQQFPQRFPTSGTVLRQQKSRRSTSGCSLLSSYDESARTSKKTTSIASGRTSPIKRESYDTSTFPDTDSADSTFPVEDSVRHLQLDDRTPLSSHPDSSTLHHASTRPLLHMSRSRPGLKRPHSQSPPPSQPDLSHAANAQLLAAAGMNTDPYRPPRRLSPGHPFAPNQGSISSQSSAGPRNNSYASSAGLSVGGSSITSLDQHSPGTISPSSEQQAQHYQQHNGQDSPYITSLPMNQVPRNARSQPQPQYPPPPSLDNGPDPSLDQKPQMNPSQRRSNGPNMQSSAYICQCCPKKPKKFDTEQELRNHESEKQYSCQYCANRFKNKNEAERHQNSLHLRKHSWSCATLNGQYDSAFYPSTAIPPSDNNPTSQPPPAAGQPVAFDTCGYCGEQFPNDPPDWEARAAHLTNVHKFGECNQSKKFFRADHFRQHLKHSHGGKSGKWTNMLEGACMKEEPNPVPVDTTQSQGAPVANMGMGQPTGQPGLDSPNMAPNVAQQPMNHANMANMVQANMAQQQGYPPPHMNQQNMTQASMAQQAQQIVQMDMSNIDPSIGLQQMGGMAPMGHMGNMSGHGRGMNMPGGQYHEKIEEMPQEM